MADVSIRHRQAAPAQAPGPQLRLLQPYKPLVLTVASILLIIAIGGLTRSIIEVYHDAMTLTGLSADPAPVHLAIGPEELAIPGNMIRSDRTRRGGPVERADLALFWPTLEGYSPQLADVFQNAGPNAPLIYTTISTRDEPLDSTGRLDEVYSRFFVEKPLPGPSGLVGRKLSAESGYGGEIIYFIPSEPRPFVARCVADGTPEMPAMCLRDINFGRGLSVLYRFNRSLLPQWRQLDAGIQKLVTGFIVPN
ncbi:MAG TPA: hypothetical protein VHA70_10885 [Bauldia sp.]|nr:hypothetical protein [Bauldia sp.]